MNVPDLLQRVAACGYSVGLTPEGEPRLLKARSECIMPPALLADLKRNRLAVVAFLSECEVCGRDASDPEDRARLADPAFCDRGDTRHAVTDGNGRHHPEEPRCPFKPR